MQLVISNSVSHEDISSSVNERRVWRLSQHANTNSTTYKCNRSIVNCSALSSTYLFRDGNARWPTSSKSIDIRQPMQDNAVVSLLDVRPPDPLRETRHRSSSCRRAFRLNTSSMRPGARNLRTFFARSRRPPRGPNGRTRGRREREKEREGERLEETTQRTPHGEELGPSRLIRGLADADIHIACRRRHIYWHLYTLYR